MLEEIRRVLMMKSSITRLSFSSTRSHYSSCVANVKKKDVSCERLSCGRVQPSSSPKREGEGCTLSRTRTKKRQQPLCAAISACKRVPPYLLIYNYSVRVTRASRGGRPLVFLGGDAADCSSPSVLVIGASDDSRQWVSWQ